jgi:predicted nucleic acid-binding protein
LSALLDSNVLVASLLGNHPAYASAVDLIDGGHAVLIAAHALSELYNTLTKPKFYGWEPVRAALSVTEFERRCTVVTLSATEHVRALCDFAACGGVGATVYDYLIGAVARRAGATAVVTLNVKHFTPYFPDLKILTPAQYLEAL